MKKRGIENDILTKITNYLTCLFLQKFKGKGYFELIYNSLPDKIRIKNMLLDLVLAEHPKTSTQIVEEFRAEYPQDWEEILRVGKKTFGESCTSILSPEIFLTYMLKELEKESKITKIIQGKEHSWKKGI